MLSSERRLTAFKQPIEQNLFGSGIDKTHGRYNMLRFDRAPKVTLQKRYFIEPSPAPTDQRVALALSR